MPGTSAAGVKRLWAWVSALVAGVAVVLIAPATAGAVVGAQDPAGVTVRAVGADVVVVDSPIESGLEVVPDGAPVPVRDAAVRGVSDVAPAATVGAGTGIAGAAVAGQAAGAPDLSMESVSAPPAAVPWIVVALLILVVAGAARAYSRSPQRAIVRGRRPPS